MRWRALAFVSLALNLLLASVWLAMPSPGARRPVPRPSPQVSPPPVTNGRPRIVFRKQFFTWQEVESPDYPTYIANLRDIGCPEQTIRDIIIADVNGLFARRRATELITPEQQWWRSEPDTNVLQLAVEKSRALDDERRTLLTRLLGTNWESGDLVNLPRPSRPGVVLDGAVLGTLPVDVKQSLQEISTRSEDRIQAYLDAQRAQGKEPDPVEMAKLRQQTRNELSRVLSPPQLEEFLLRYSQYATDLRTQFGQLQFFNPTADEFRAVFRATDTLDEQIQLLADSTDPNSVQARQALEAQRENAIKLALGPERYQEYQMLHDPAYRDAVATADDAGTPEAAKTLYQINLAVLSQQDAINSNTNLSAEQRAIKLKELELDQLKANALATGQQLPPEAPAPPPEVPRAVYVIKPFDTVGSVMRESGLPISAILAANPNVDFTKLRPGDSIYLPQFSAPRPQGP